MIDLQPGEQLIVVTDLDGTLLDHHSYRPDEALPVLARLKQLGIPVVINTSKTRAEWLPMAQELGLDGPYVVENGSALYRGTEEVIFGTPRADILQLLKPLRESFAFTGYTDVDVPTVMEWTGLDHKSAERSHDRHFSEPLVWQDVPERQQEFCAAVEQVGLTTLEGGRFLHVQGQTDKGQPLAHLECPDVRIIALGDRPNDLAMLQRADLGIVIATPDGDDVLPGDDFLRSTLTGPRGWAEMMTPLLDRLFSQPHTHHG